MSMANEIFNIEAQIGGVAVIAHNDYGVDRTVILSSMLQKVISPGQHVEVRDFDKPVEIKLAVKGNSIPAITV